MSEAPRAPLLSSPYTAIPGPFGQPAAVDALGSVAAPFLAGFTFALIGLVLQSGQGMRWPDATLAFLMLAALLLIATVQFAFSARRFYVSPVDWAAWQSLAVASREEHLKQQVEFFLAAHQRWLERARYAYNLGVMVLFFAVALALVPGGPVGEMSSWRLLAIALSLLGLVAEGWWSLSGELEKWRPRLRHRSAEDS